MPATLKDLVFFQRGFDITKSQQNEGPFPVVSSSGIHSYHSESRAQGPGVVIGRKGTLGSIHYLDEAHWPHDTTLWSKSFNGNNPKFAFYALHLVPLERFNVGGANPTLNRNHIHDLPIRIPSLEIQTRIAELLGNYDRLIENNRRRIRLLEESARLLYKEWFVYLRFPGHEHVKIADGVPEGWNRRPLEQLADIVMGQSPKSEHYNDVGNGLPFHQGVSDFGERFVEHAVYCIQRNRLAEAGDILCSVRAPVGRINLTEDRVIIGRGLSALRSKTGIQSFLYYQLKAHFFKENMIGGGAIFAAITKKDLQQQRLLCPKETMACDFEDLVRPVDKQISNLHQQSKKLRHARDLLLPRLMSGEIAV